MLDKRALLRSTLFRLLLGLLATAAFFTILYFVAKRWEFR